MSLTCLQNVKTRTKLIGSSMVMILLLIVTGYVGYISTKRIYSNLDQIFAVGLPSLDVVIEADRDLQQLLVAERTMIFSDPASEDFSTLVDDYLSNQQQAQERIEKFAALNSHADDQRIVADFRNAWQEWLPVSKKIVEARQQGTAEGQQLALELSTGEAAVRFEAMRDHLDKLTEVILLDAGNAKASARATFGLVGKSILAVVIIAVLFGLFITLILDRSILRPLQMPCT